ncbi:MAG TPA: hypothetical protein VE078_02320 [Thermoanaerobaculia bacterium]|nr:hypothetical protein [Thermoanaerobaculia bacterium]
MTFPRPAPHRCLLSGRITLLRAEERSDSRNLDLGWGRITSAVEIHTVPGNHLTLIAEPNVRDLARQLRETLENAWAETVEA